MFHLVNYLRADKDSTKCQKTPGWLHGWLALNRANEGVT